MNTRALPNTPLRKHKTNNDLITLVLADEDADDRELCISILNDLKIPFKTFEVTNGLDLLNLIYGQDNYQDIKIVPNAIIMDLNMPTIGGFEVLQKLKTDDRCKEVPVYILSNSYIKQDVELASFLGSSGYYKKTLCHADWKNAITNICNEVNKQFRKDKLSI